MAMIKCSECGKDVSDKATTCPNCGNPISEPKYVDNRQSSNPAIFAYISVIGGILSLIGCFIPFVTVSVFGASQSASLFKLSVYGMVAIGFSLLGIVLSVPKAKNKYLLPFVAGLVNVIIAFSEVNRVKGNAGNYSSIVHTDMGFYLVIGGAIAMIIGSAIANSFAKKK